MYKSMLLNAPLAVYITRHITSIYKHLCLLFLCEFVIWFLPYFKGQGNVDYDLFVTLDRVAKQPGRPNKMLEMSPFEEKNIELLLTEEGKLQTSPIQLLLNFLKIACAGNFFRRNSICTIGSVEHTHLLYTGARAHHFRWVCSSLSLVAYRISLFWEILYAPLEVLNTPTCCTLVPGLITFGGCVHHFRWMHIEFPLPTGVVTINTNGSNSVVAEILKQTEVPQMNV